MFWFDRIDLIGWQRIELTDVVCYLHGLFNVAEVNEEQNKLQ